MSAIIRRKEGRNRFRRCANSELTDVPLYSRPVRSQLRLKLMFDGCQATPSSSSIAMKFGYVQSLKTMKPVSTAQVRPASSTSTVLVWPPG